MVGITLKQELLNFINYMHEQGILDLQFHNIRNLQSPEFPQLVSRIISIFINDADVSMEAMAKLLSDEVIDFDNLLRNHVHRLQERSVSIGGCRMAQVCYELHIACHERDKDRCIEIFERVKLEYRALREMLSHILQLEQSIFLYESRRCRF